MLDHRPGVHHVCKGGGGSCIVNLNRSEYKPHQRETKASTNTRRPNGSIPNSFTLSEQQVPERRPEGSRREHRQTTQQTTAGWQCTHTHQDTPRAPGTHGAQRRRGAGLGGSFSWGCVVPRQHSYRERTSSRAVHRYAAAGLIRNVPMSSAACSVHRARIK
jgi:hypothetical protein